MHIHTQIHGHTQTYPSLLYQICRFKLTREDPAIFSHSQICIIFLPSLLPLATSFLLSSSSNVIFVSSSCLPSRDCVTECYRWRTATLPHQCSIRGKLEGWFILVIHYVMWGGGVCVVCGGGGGGAGVYCFLLMEKNRVFLSQENA